MDADEAWTVGVDPGRASAARVYDYFLGGRYHLPPDRQAAEAVVSITPNVPRQARANRAFLQRMVKYLVHLGIRQFLDIGSGIPASGNVHDIAQDAAPDARVLYVDIDPVAVMTANQILAENPHATAIEADLRRPEQLLGQINRPDVQTVIDLAQPTALLLVAVLHFIPDDADPYQAVGHLRDQLAPGSYLAISHGASESYTQQEAQRVAAAYGARSAPLPTPRSRQQVAQFFANFEVQEPGIVWLPEWRPGPAEDFADDPVGSGAHAGLGRRPD
ncbi:S-adenosyl methyltransferase [Micromonospora sp. Llam0]|uniref:SAM-dependent methyltransferase n=1 Tax=Micromonospora sp. Llam0 TaxID=2485143 RepID=UPI000F4A244D|nr:SAM-dependent methyltransferase [Micromonospora sp. Llam0]ROO52798.1 S-adenosyl methyltransferase [Micromonospora sp. Llam0]